MTAPAALPPFDRVVDEHGDVVLRVCRAVLAATPGADAGDAWSETFLAALRAYPDLPPGSNVRGWLVTIAHNKAIDQLRAAGRRATPVAAVPDSAPPPGVSVFDVTAPDPSLIAAVASLAPKQRAAVAHRYLADLGYAEIAVILDCSEAAARRSAADGIARLRDLVHRDPLEGDPLDQPARTQPARTQPARTQESRP